MKNIKIIAFDADDTLWENEPIFTDTHQKCQDLLANHVNSDILLKELYVTELKNLNLFGYGIKGFMLSMIETAIELSDGKITSKEIQGVINLGKEMLKHPVHLIDNVEDTLKKLSPNYELMLITKGDLFDQESKIARSGLANYFQKIEIVSEKYPETYQNILDKHQIEPKTFLMVGNSLKSDVIPVCKIGGNAIHIPFRTTWIHERVPENELIDVNYQTLKSISMIFNTL